MSISDDFMPAVIPPAEWHEPAWWFIFQDRRLLVQLTDEQAHLPMVVDPEELGLIIVRRQYLGRLNGRHCYSAEVSGETEPAEGWTFHGLRRLFGRLQDELFWIAGAAVQIVDWDRNHQYCGHCGAVNRDRERERAKECPQCGLISYPRISPAVIVLVERGDKLLLARSHRHTSGMYSVLAGFVEPGETLEQAVRREIREEVSIEVGDIRYFGSQPWPFPNSLMIAFTCRHAAGEIVLDETEMADAGWFDGHNLPPIPPRVSIARQLIDWFLHKHNYL
jgi:NAD+ diphosphatase